MSTVALKLSPADYGRRLTLDDFDSAEFLPGFKYELVDGRLYVAAAPNYPEEMLVDWMVWHLKIYAKARPKVINFVATKGRIFLPGRSRRRQTVPEPDIACFTGVPRSKPSRTIRWQDMKPVLVVEVLVDGEFDKDFGRNPDLYFRVPSIQEYWVINGSANPDEPSLVQYVRRGTDWAVTTYPYGSRFTTKLLPGFEILVDPRK